MKKIFLLFVVMLITTYLLQDLVLSSVTSLIPVLWGVLTTAPFMVFNRDKGDSDRLNMRSREGKKCDFRTLYAADSACWPTDGFGYEDEEEEEWVVL